MASSTCNKQLALCLVASLVAGCAIMPSQPSGDSGVAQQQDAQPGLSKAQMATFKEGAAALAAGNADKAAAIFKRLTKVAPGVAAVHANLGTALMMRGDYALAAAAFERATALNPDLVEAYVRLGVARRHIGQFQKAEAAYKAALARDPDNRYAHLNLGILYDVYLRKPQQALAHYRRFQKLSAKPDKEVAKWIKDLKRRL